MQRFVLNAGLSVLLFFIFFACAPKGYKDAVKTAVRLEIQHEYEQAYEHYKQALKSKPNDKAVMRKLSALGRTIADSFAEEALKATENKRYKTALDIVNKALGYDENNEKAKDCLLKARKEYDKIQKQYSQVKGLIEKNMWSEAYVVLKEISALYDDDLDLGAKIENVENDGYAYYMKVGLEARNDEKYSQSLNYFKLAETLKTLSESRQEIIAAKKYIEANSLYLHAQQRVDNNSILEAMDSLIQAMDLVEDHKKVNQMVVKLMPDWSPKIFKNGKMFKDSNQIEKSLIAFNSLNRINPGYPEAKKYFEEVSFLYLKKNYKHMLAAQKTGAFSAIMEASKNILDVDPGFLDTSEIMIRAAIKAFNMFYQQGLYYMKTGNFGKAVLCFRSAEHQLVKSGLTRALIKESLDRIKKESALNMVFLDFSQEIGDSSVIKYITEQIRERIEAGGGGKRFKNITIAVDTNKEYDMLTQSALSSDIDWGSVLRKGYNAVITGRIRLLKQDTSVNSEWKTRKRTVRRIIDNEKYSRLMIRQAKLKAGMRLKTQRPMTANEKYVKVANNRDIYKARLESGELSAGQKKKYQAKIEQLDLYLAKISAKRMMSKGEMKYELESIEEILPTIPSKIEADVEEETPYQFVRHTMTAYMQIDVDILAPDGSHIWPVKRYEETFQIEDTVVPPNLMSDDPKERMGDPLSLPSESSFKEQAIDYIVDKRIISDLVANFQSYGMEFYKKAIELNASQRGLESGSAAFLDSIEEYYRFLACYMDKGEEDNLQEEVEKKLESHISDLWLIRKKNRF